jgi:hypothetical protein
MAWAPALNFANTILAQGRIPHMMTFIPAHPHEAPLHVVETLSIHRAPLPPRTGENIWDAR